MSGEPLSHIVRPALPWRDADRTECGKPTNDVASCISRDDALQQVKREGIQRAAYSLCMTCIDTMKRWPREWADDPVEALGREYYGGRRHPSLEGELRALAALVEAHRDEFDGYLTGLADTVSLAAHRQQRRRHA
jgi:hypothetical protein